MVLRLAPQGGVILVLSLKDFARPNTGHAMATISAHMPRSHRLAAASGHIRYSYNPNWSCPIPPKENRLTVAIRAGEKVFESEGHE